MFSVRAAIALPVLAITALTLSACVPTQEPSDRPTPSASTTRTPGAAPSSTPTPTPTPDGPIPYSVSCDELLSPDTLYGLDPNFSSLGPAEPAAGSLAATAVADGGTACRWIHETSSVTIDIAVAELTPDAAASRRASADASGTAVADFGDAGYFASDSGAQVFRGPYWITVSSSMFASAADAAPFVNAVTAGY
ncbi:hypothetical protein M2152_000719 [Microbacteriaceae bacterium SG_E_30_P1]|uniref:DUF3558 domain-containing protein n=1 Tax=Antiquaquibacter oligotrophicus TaxID=2880260 RepID=A0ABT6KN65_9MICO|nr:hypothetical protein [Antiquaquibacter oligotrophicus]MDH6180537.1 hypothetical protein [Antiquaquibacter oligotrophicus]UDF13729.1 hypothetical protein LH407_02415 [Antiquaquibacter oligotrophicus]